ncbi:Hypothetical predicted protein, partial [Pelobates cultripes]
YSQTHGFLINGCSHNDKLSSPPYTNMEFNSTLQDKDKLSSPQYTNMEFSST